MTSDLVDICNAGDSHAEIASRRCRRKHVFCEKPLGGHGRDLEA